MIYHMSYSLNSLKGVMQGLIQGSIMGGIKGDTSSLDDGSYAPFWVRSTGVPPLVLEPYKESPVDYGPLTRGVYLEFHNRVRMRIPNPNPKTLSPNP